MVDNKKKDEKLRGSEVLPEQKGQEGQEEEVDKLDEFLSDVPEWLREPLKQNYKQILAGIAIVIVVSVLFSGYSYYTRHLEESASFHLGMAMAKQDVDSRIKELKVIKEKFGHTNAARLATLLLARAYMEKGDFRAAQESFERASSSLKGVMADSSLMGLGYTFEEQKKFDEALSSFKKVEQNKNGLEAVAVLDEARVYREKGEKEKAIDAFNRYLDMEPTSPFLDYIRYQVLDLSS